MLASCALFACSPQAAVPVPVPVGRYVVQVSASGLEFLTREKTVSTSVEGAAWLDLAAGGKATACAGWVRTEGYDVSHFASSDGQDHHSENEERRLLALTGTWAATASGVDVRLSSGDAGVCGAAKVNSAAPIVLACAPTVVDGLPGPALACTPDGPTLDALRIGGAPLRLSAAPGLGLTARTDRGVTETNTRTLATPADLARFAPR